jgi:uncharacterized protein
MERTLFFPSLETMDGNQQAQFNLGIQFYIGDGVQKDLFMAFKCFQKGVLLQILQNINTLSALLLPAAEAGDIDAQFNLGDMYLTGIGVEANPVKAVEWYQKGMLSRILQNINTLSALLSPAAESGLPQAQSDLGHMYRRGEGVEANPVKAVEWYQKGMLSRILQNINTLSALLSPAAKAGLPLAQNNLGCMYQNGLGVEANPVKAVEWYRKGMLS